MKTMTRKTVTLVTLLAAAMLLLLAVACGGDSEEEQPAATSPSSATGTTGTTGATSPDPTTAAAPGTGQQATPEPTTQASSQPAATAEPEEKLSVVSTSNIVADWVREVGGDRVDVFPLLPPNADPHTYQPGAQDIARIADADLVFSIGLSLEARWFEELVENAARDHDSIIALGESVDPIDFVEIFDDHDDHGHDDHGHGEHGEEILGRLLVGDGETGMLSVIDLEHGDVEQNAFDMGSRAGRIYTTKSGRFAIAVSSDANTAHVFDGGIYLEAHGDHFDLVEDDVERLDIDLSGDRPVHLYVGGEWAAIFYDGSGDVVLLNEHELEEEGSDYVPPVLNAGPQHGGAVPLEHDLFAITTQHPDYDSAPEDYRLPIGAHISDLDGNIIHSAEGCEGLHGDAGNGHMAVFGCMGGVLVLEEHGDHFDDYFIGPPAGSPEDFRITSVWGYPGLHHFFGLGSAVGLYIIEPEDGFMEQVIPASEDLRPINVAISHDGEALFVVMSDGELRMYDAHDMDLLASVDDFLTEPVETGFYARPHVVTAPGAVFITDSLGGEVMQLDDHDLEEVNHWDIDGNPTKIAFVGIYGETEGHEEHGHEEHDDHDEEEHDEHMEGEDEHGHHDHAHGEHDPHFWFDPVRVQQAVNVIAAQLSTIDSAGQTSYRENAAAYNRELDDLDHWIEEQVAALPDDHRVLVTSHDAYQYYAQRYGFEVVGTIFPLTTEVEPSAQDLAMLAELIEHEGVPAVFGETTHSDRLLRRIAEETGATIIGGLYSGSLGEPGGEAGNYLDMMRFNTTLIVEALK